MSLYIDIDKEMDRLDDRYTLGEISRDERDELMNYLEYATKHINFSQWIPCSRKLPTIKGEYLVTYHPCHWDNVSSEVKVGTDTFRGRTSWAKEKHQKVIAWMPKPEAYRE